MWFFPPHCSLLYGSRCCHGHLRQKTKLEEKEKQYGCRQCCSAWPPINIRPEESRSRIDQKILNCTVWSSVVIKNQLKQIQTEIKTKAFSCSNKPVNKSWWNSHHCHHTALLAVYTWGSCAPQAALTGAHAGTSCPGATAHLNKICSRIWHQGAQLIPAHHLNTISGK